MRKVFRAAIVLVSAVFVLTAMFTGCQSKPSSGELMMDISGETFPIKKTGLFGKNFEFWEFKIQNVTASGTKKSGIGLKGSEVETSSRAFGLELKDPEGYEWDIVGLAEMNRAQRPDMGRKEFNLASYEVTVRMEETTTQAMRVINARYRPSDPGFNGTLSGTVTNEKNEVIATFESNARLDTYEKPDDGFLVFSIDVNDTPVAVVDRREGDEITFFEGLQPVERSQVAATLSSLYVLMRYGVL